MEGIELVLIMLTICVAGYFIMRHFCKFVHDIKNSGNE